MKKYIAFFIALLFCGVALANVIDDSPNKPSFPPGGVSLVRTVAGSSSRQSITVQNQSTDTIQIWKDINCTGNQLTLVVLGPASGTGLQGGAWSSNTFKSCIRVYAPNSGDQIAIYQD